MGLRVIQPCLLCDSPQEIDLDDWKSKEAPFVLCPDCASYIEAGLMSWPMVRMIYMLRCQIGTILTKIDEMGRRMNEIMKTQQEMEREYLGRKAV